MATAAQANARYSTLGHRRADQGAKNTQIAEPQRATNQTSESQTSTSSRFMILPDDVGLAVNSAALMR